MEINTPARVYNFPAMRNLLLLAIIMSTSACGLSGHRVPRPDSDVDFTYKIGWWPYQDRLVVNTLTVEVLDSKLYLFTAPCKAIATGGDLTSGKCISRKKFLKGATSRTARG
jgi:hypothetical protein